MPSCLSREGPPRQGGVEACRQQDGFKGESEASRQGSQLWDTRWDSCRSWLLWLGLWGLAWLGGRHLLLTWGLGAVVGSRPHSPSFDGVEIPPLEQGCKLRGCEQRWDPWRPPLPQPGLPVPSPSRGSPCPAAQNLRLQVHSVPWLPALPLPLVPLPRARNSESGPCGSAEAGPRPVCGAPPTSVLSSLPKVLTLLPSGGLTSIGVWASYSDSLRSWTLDQSCQKSPSKIPTGPQRGPHV